MCECVRNCIVRGWYDISEGAVWCVFIILNILLLKFIKALLYTVSVEYECVFWTSNECSA